ncbi:hypothetical protein [Bradyrhizobium lablabi]|uniref:hypothetical protein n=1 Tax=Bradyrhizobium lablabi TaxID=722472 RepID=UPI001BA77E00|nr:hypothetical protein [Bradyrhizobium lablabi]MBR0697746.1 hypothetical protein [Bradyrhizobium lablabi]
MRDNSSADVFRNRLLSRFAIQLKRHIAPIVLEGAVANDARHDSRLQELVKVRELRTFTGNCNLN